MFNKNIAFTLAETLIVIAIIGVVAALTLPNLNSSTADKEKVTKVKKIYAALTEATDRAQAVYGPIDSWFNGLSDAEASKKAKNRITEFMKVSKDCGQAEGCWSTDTFYRMDGEELSENYYDESSSDHYYVNLADGTSIAIHANDTNGGYIEFYVDLDGPNKGKTMFGSDIFFFTIAGENAWGHPKGQLGADIAPENWTGTNILIYPTAWILTNDNADYLKATCTNSGTCTCPDGNALNWESKTSCN